jgi:orotidine-5'-phosphate decarboxylase
MQIAARDQLIVALDVPELDQARQLVEGLGDAVSFYKVGMELVYGHGFGFIKELTAAGKKVFLDLKLHDIPNTVQKATEQLAGLGVTFLTVHAYPQTMQAAKAGSRGSNLQILGVTVMTSYDDQDLIAAGYDKPVRDVVRIRAQAAKEIGISGLILSPEEVAAMRALVGKDLLLVTPGIRPAHSEANDQKRFMTPKEAIMAGANHLVVGRPVTKAPNPRASALSIIQEIHSANHSTLVSGASR